MQTPKKLRPAAPLSLDQVEPLDAPFATDKPAAEPRRLSSPLTVIALLGVFLIALWFRTPLIGYGLPYMYDEDEAHHFNRVVTMMKTGDLNPHYFYKPALHFYLRLPVTALAFFKGVERGDLRELDDIKVRNKYGVAEHEFTASHPILVKYNRAFTLLLALAGLAVVLSLAVSIGRPIAGVAAALILACSPLHIQLSTHIGVDMLMTGLVLLSTFLSLQYMRTPRYGTLIGAGLCAGLAVASKYNAFCAVLPPLAALLLSTSTGRISAISGTFAVLLAAAVGFLAGAPYSLIDLPAFLNGAAFEIHHYKTGNGINPGFDQLLFYTGVLGRGALGWPVLLLSVLGVLFAFRGDRGARRQLIVLLAFPVSFMWYMSLQRVNYERNVLPVMPFLALFAGIALSEVTTMLVRAARAAKEYPSSSPAPAGLFHLLVPILFITVLTPPLLNALPARAALTSWQDSRELALKWLKSEEASGVRTAVAGELLLPRSFREERKLTQFSYDRILEGRGSYFALWNRGVSQVLIPWGGNPAVDAERSLTVARTFSGLPAPQRVIKNPEMAVLEINVAAEVALLQKQRERLTAGEKNITPLTISRSGALLLDTDLSGVGIEDGWSKFRDERPRTIELSENQAARNSPLPRTFRTIEGRYGSILLNAPERLPSDVTLELIATSPSQPQELSIVVNGKELGRTAVSSSWSKRSVVLQKADLEEAVRIHSPARLEFIASQTRLPDDEVGEGRASSIAVHRIQLRGVPVAPPVQAVPPTPTSPTVTP